MQIRRVLFAILLILVTSPLASSQPPGTLRGFTADGSAAERQAEEKFRAIPKPDNLREYMRVITGAPHHAGSPNSRRVAEYVLSQFKAAGLNASVEAFEALMPYPKERQLEL